MINDIRLGMVLNDRSFDLIYPKAVQQLSRTHWTSIDVAQCAASWLVTSPKSRILDVGSGAGKFCFIGALHTRAAFVGYERLPVLALLAKELAKQYKIENVKFVNGDALHAPWQDFDGAYLYNPFAQELALTKQSVSSKSSDRTNFTSHQGRLAALLEAAKVGFRVAVYCGFGSKLHPSYRLIAAEHFGPGPLEIWERGNGALPGQLSSVLT